MSELLRLKRLEAAAAVDGHSARLAEIERNLFECEASLGIVELERQRESYIALILAMGAQLLIVRLVCRRRTLLPRGDQAALSHALSLTMQLMAWLDSVVLTA